MSFRNVMSFRRRCRRQLKQISAAVGAAVAAVVSSTMIESEPAHAQWCYDYEDWAEGDVIFDDEWHQVAGSTDPEINDPDGEWELVKWVYDREGFPHAYLVEGYTTAPEHPLSGTCDIPPPPPGG